MDVIYLDELIALNALVDYLLLTLSARLALLPLRRGRYAAAALLGGLYAAAAAVFPAARGAGAALTVSLLLARVSFGGGRALRRGWGAFMALSALFAGAVYAGALLGGGDPGRGGPIAGLSLRLGLVSFGAVWACVRLGLACLQRQRAGGLQRVELRLGERRAALYALRDTGNGLADPVSGVRVLIADAGALSPLLGGRLPAPLLSDAAGLFRHLSEDAALAGRLRLLPYAAVGNPGALLVCLRPDAAAVDGTARRLLIGISPTPLGEGEYEAVY